MTQMTRDEALEATAAIGHVAVGGYKMLGLLVRLGAPQALGLSREEWLREAGGPVRLAAADRPEAVAELASEGMSGRAIADVLGVSDGTVRNDRRAQDCAPDPSDQGEPASRAQDCAPDPEALAERKRLAEADAVARDRARERERAERDEREREEGRADMAFTVRAAVAVLGNRASLAWLPERLAAVQPPIAADERAQALAAMSVLLGEPC